MAVWCDLNDRDHTDRDLADQSPADRLMPIRYSAPCDRCGSLYVVGSNTTCARCMRTKDGGNRRWRSKARLRCDCGKDARAVVIVKVGSQQDEQIELRMPVCSDCLEIEKETQAKLDRLGYGSD